MRNLKIVLVALFSYIVLASVVTMIVLVSTDFIVVLVSLVGTYLLTKTYTKRFEQKESKNELR